MNRLKVVAGWLGLIAAAILVALLFLSVKAAAEERERALDASEAAITDLRESRQAFRAERAQLHGQVDDLLRQVEALRRQSSTLRKQVEVLQGQVVAMGGTPRIPQPQPQGGGSPKPKPPSGPSGQSSDRSPQQAPPEPTHPGCVNGKGPKECR